MTLSIKTQHFETRLNDTMYNNIQQNDVQHDGILRMSVSCA